MAVGSHYTVQISRREGTLTLHGTPKYTGSAADEATRRALWTEHTLAQTMLEASRAERDVARRNALDEAVAPLLKVAAGLRTGAPRDALAAYVIRKFSDQHVPYDASELLFSVTDMSVTLALRGYSGVQS
jgi:hypothetical protein